MLISFKETKHLSEKDKYYMISLIYGIQENKIKSHKTHRKGSDLWFAEVGGRRKVKWRNMIKRNFCL